MLNKRQFIHQSQELLQCPGPVPVRPEARPRQRLHHVQRGRGLHGGRQVPRVRRTSCDKFEIAHIATHTGQLYRCSEICGIILDNQKGVTESALLEKVLSRKKRSDKMIKSSKNKGCCYVVGSLPEGKGKGLISARYVLVQYKRGRGKNDTLDYPVYTRKTSKLQQSLN